MKIEVVGRVRSVKAAGKGLARVWIGHYDLETLSIHGRPTDVPFFEGPVVLDLARNEDGTMPVKEGQRVLVSLTTAT